jgi:cobalt/nickel transport system permease protein
MLRSIDRIACSNRWSRQSDAVGLLCAGLMLVVFLAPPLYGPVMVIVAAWLLAVFGAGVPVAAYSRALVLPAAFIALGVVGLCFSVDFGQPGWIATEPAGAHLALVTGMRAWAAAAVTLLFSFTVPVTHLLAMLRRLRVPETLLDLVHLTYRMLFLLDESRRVIVQAQSSRLGYCNARTALRSTGQVAAGLFIRAILHAFRLERGSSFYAHRRKRGVLTASLRSLSPRCLEPRLGSFRVRQGSDAEHRTATDPIRVSDERRALQSAPRGPCWNRSDCVPWGKMRNFGRQWCGEIHLAPLAKRDA